IASNRRSENVTTLRFATRWPLAPAPRPHRTSLVGLWRLHTQRFTPITRELTEVLLGVRGTVAGHSRHFGINRNCAQGYKAFQRGHANSRWKTTSHALRFLIS